MAADWCYHTETCWVMNRLTLCLVAPRNCFKAQYGFNMAIFICVLVNVAFFIHLLNVMICYFGGCAAIAEKNHCLNLSICGYLLSLGYFLAWRLTHWYGDMALF